MPISVVCACGKRLRAKDEMAGKRATCPGCGNTLIVPMDEPAYDADDAPSMPYDMNEPPRVRPVETAPVRPPPPVPVPIPDYAAPRASRMPSVRHWLYFIFLLALIPLMTYTHTSHEETAIQKRLEDTVEHHPESLPAVEQALEAAKQASESGTDEEAATEQLFQALPDHRLEGAFLAHDTFGHWVLALIAGVAFMGLVSLMFPENGTNWIHLGSLALFTGTAGILLLLGFQWVAFHTQGIVVHGGGRIAILFYLVQFIGFSYRAALNPENGFLLSALGFTLGVGLCEELCKTLPLFWHFRTRGTLSWRGACMWGLASGIGFGVSEGITYAGRYYNGIDTGGIYLVRFASCVALHAMWSGASALWIYKNQDKISGADNFLAWLGVILLVLAVPMVLHGCYDTLLKKGMDAGALVVAVVSFGWLALVVEWTRWQEQKQGLWQGSAA